MDRIVKYFIEEKKVTEVVATVLAKSLSKYPDIKDEFIYWIENGSLNEMSPLEVEGYSAQKISQVAPHLDMAGVYNFMVTLRENPLKAKSYIEKGFPRK